MKIEKKTWPELFQKMADGDKTHDLRLADFKCSLGDILVLREWNPKTKEYTGRVLEKTVTHVIKTKDVKFWPKEDVEKYGFQIISFKQVPGQKKKHFYIKCVPQQSIITMAKKLFDEDEENGDEDDEDRHDEDTGDEDDY